MKETIFQPLALFEEHKNFSTDENVNPNYIIPKQFMYRLQKLMDEYVGGVSSNFSFNKASLIRADELFVFLKEDSEKLAARDLYELLRVWENKHRLWQAEAHLKAVAFREETRWPGYYFRTDFPTLQEEDWLCFVNMKWDPTTDEWSVFKKPILNLFGIE
jgi:adenylylsulfate reductase subunit A